MRHRLAHRGARLRSSQATPARRRGQVAEAPHTQKFGHPHHRCASVRARCASVEASITRRVLRATRGGLTDRLQLKTPTSQPCVGASSNRQRLMTARQFGGLLVCTDDGSGAIVVTLATGCSWPFSDRGLTGPSVRSAQVAVAWRSGNLAFRLADMGRTAPGFQIARNPELHALLAVGQPPSEAARIRFRGDLTPPLRAR